MLIPSIPLTMLKSLIRVANCWTARKQTERMPQSKKRWRRSRTCRICGARQSEWRLATRTSNKTIAYTRPTQMIMKNSTNFYSKEATEAMPKVKTESKMATAAAKSKTAMEMLPNLDGQKKTQGRYRDTNPPPSTKKSSRTVSFVYVFIRISHV